MVFEAITENATEYRFGFGDKIVSVFRRPENIRSEE